MGTKHGLYVQRINAFLMFSNKRCCGIYGGVQIEDGMCRRRINQELHQLLGQTTVVHLAKIERLRLAGDIIRMSDNNPVKEVFDNNPTGRRRCGA